MDADNSIIESEVIESSSDDLRSELENAFKEARDRDEGGRFKAKEEVVEPASKPVEHVEPVEPIEEAKLGIEPVAKPVESVSKPPEAWSPAAKAKFATLDPEVQAEIVRRETEVHKGFTKQDELRNFGKSIQDAVNPYLPMIRGDNSDPVRAVSTLLQSAHTLRYGTPETKADLLIGAMQQYGIDPNYIFQKLSGGQQQRQVNPEIAQLQSEVQRLTQSRQAEQQSIQAAEQAQVTQTIDSFAADPKNIYFANVKAEMAALLQSNRAKDLTEAYDMACWARPDIRPLLLQSQEQQRQAELKAKAIKARAAGSSLTGSPTGSVSGSAPQTGNLRDELTANFREIMSRD